MEMYALTKSWYDVLIPLMQYTYKDVSHNLGISNTESRLEIYSLTESWYDIAYSSDAGYLCINTWASI